MSHLQHQDAAATPLTQQPNPDPDASADDTRPMLGELAMGVPYIMRAALEAKEPLERYVPVILTHGLCHLIGHTHFTHADTSRVCMLSLPTCSYGSHRCGRPRSARLLNSQLAGSLVELYSQ